MNNLNFKKSRNLMWIGFAVGILIMLFGTTFENEKTIFMFITTGTIIFFLALIQAFLFYICPYCKKSLMDVRGEIPEYCPNCGKRLIKKQED